MNTIQVPVGFPAKQIQAPVKVKYCLYARKSTEGEERQVLSIESQVKEMLQLAEREGLEVVAMKRESHSAKETGQRPIFNEIVEELRAGKYNGILTWAADRISRNAGDLGRIVGLMDQGKGNGHPKIRKVSLEEWIKRREARTAGTSARPTHLERPHHHDR